MSINNIFDLCLILLSSERTNEREREREREGRTDQFLMGILVKCYVVK
jgi:hypothetical protein